MKKRGRNIFLSMMLILALSISLIPINYNTNVYAETSLPQADFVVPVTPLTDVEVPTDFIKITTKEQLNNIRNDLDGKYILMNDIAFTDQDFAEGGDFYNGGKGWIPIGDNATASADSRFAGTLNGNGYSISGMKIKNQSNLETYQGLLGYADAPAVIKNLAVVNATVEYGNTSFNNASIAGVAGRVGLGCLIQNCYFSGSLTANDLATDSNNGFCYVGGIAGRSGSNIESCKAEGTLLSNARGAMGGVAGSGESYINCVNKSSITANPLGRYDSSWVGGIAGGGIASNCTNYGTMYLGGTLSTNLGGILGMGSASECVNFGNVTSDLTVKPVHDQIRLAGIVAEVSGNVSNCANFGIINGGISAGGIAGVVINESSVISGCSNGGNVSASPVSSPRSGGIVGILGGTVTDCYNTGRVICTSQNTRCLTGGISAEMLTGSSIDNCFNTASVSANVASSNTFGFAYSGGIAGYMNRDTWIEYCYNTGKITASAPKSPYYTSDIYASAIHGLGIESWGVSNCYYLKGYADEIYATGLALADFGYASKFENFDFTNIWIIDSELLRPVLKAMSRITFEIKYELNGGTLPTASPTRIMPGSNNILPTPSKAGYSFAGWFTTSALTGTAVKTIPETSATNVTYYAKWTSPILSAASYNYNSIKVSWAAAGNATSYRIYRATSATGTYSLVKIADSTSRFYVNTGLVTGKTYYYKVSVVAGGKTYHHGTYKYAKAIPTTPTISLSKYSTTSIKVSWTGVSGSTKYQIFRASSATGTYTLVYTASSTTRSWVNTGLTRGKTYYYKVRAYHLEGTTKVYGSTSAVKYLKI
jgi:uncharacterized repeat protein (TIGR02543 family)